MKNYKIEEKIEMNELEAANSLAASRDWENEANLVEMGFAAIDWNQIAEKIQLNPGVDWDVIIGTDYYNDDDGDTYDIIKNFWSADSGLKNINIKYMEKFDTIYSSEGEVVKIKSIKKDGLDPEEYEKEKARFSDFLKKLRQLNLPWIVFRGRNTSGIISDLKKEVGNNIDITVICRDNDKLAEKGDINQSALNDITLKEISIIANGGTTEQLFSTLRYFDNYKCFNLQREGVMTPIFSVIDKKIQKN